MWLFIGSQQKLSARIWWKREEERERIEREEQRTNWRKFYINILYVYIIHTEERLGDDWKNCITMKYQRIYLFIFFSSVFLIYAFSIPNDCACGKPSYFHWIQISSHANKYKIFKACSLYAKMATWISSVDYFDSYDDNEKDATNLRNTKA